MHKLHCKKVSSVCYEKMDKESVLRMSIGSEFQTLGASTLKKHRSVLPEAENVMTIVSGDIKSFLIFEGVSCRSVVKPEWGP